MKRMWNLGFACNHFRDGQRLVSAVGVASEVDDEVVGNLVVDLGQELLCCCGGIRPLPRRRALARLCMAEREEISRGLAAGHSLRRIATDLGRAPSTVCPGAGHPSSQGGETE